MRGGVDPRDPGAEPQVDVVGGVPVHGMDVDLLPLGLPLEVALRERRPLVGPLVLLADEDDPTVEALLAERRRRGRAGEARTHDHERPGGRVVRHRYLL